MFVIGGRSDVILVSERPINENGWYRFESMLVKLS